MTKPKVNREQAVEIARDFLQTRYKYKEGSLPKQIKATSRQAEYMSLIPECGATYDNFPADDFNDLIKKAKNDPEYWDALIQTCSTWLKKKMTLPDVMSGWVIDVMKGKNKRPKQQGRYKDCQARSQLAHAAYLVHEQGVQLDKNSATEHNNYAFSIVAEATQKLAPFKCEGKPDIEPFKVTTESSVRNCYWDFMKRNGGVSKKS